MYKYITTYEDLKQAVLSYLLPYCNESKDNILALDLETYLTSLCGYISESDSDDDTLMDEEDDDETRVAKIVKEAAAKKKRKKLIPRPLKLKDGSLTGQVRTLALGLSPFSQIFPGGLQLVIDLKAIGYEPVAKLLKPILERQLILGHNLKYDWEFLKMHMGITIKRMIDTMHVAKILGNGVDEGFSLSDLYEKFLNHDFFFEMKKMTIGSYKDVKKRNQVDEDWKAEELKESQIEYAADDVLFIHYVWDTLKTLIKMFSDTYETDIEREHGIRSVIRLESSLIPVVAMAEMRGICIDVERHRQYVIPLLEQNRDRAVGKLPFKRTFQVKRATGRGANRVVEYLDVTESIKLTSPEQLKIALYDLLKPYGTRHRQTFKLNKKGKDLVDQGVTNPEDYEGVVKKVDKCYITFMFPNGDGTFREEEILINTAEETVKRFVFEDELLDLLPDEVVTTITDVLAAKQSISLLSKFGEKLIRVCTDRGYLHTNFNQLGTDSGRMSSSGDMNVQQIIAKGELRDGNHTSLAALFRSAIRAGKPVNGRKRKLVGADYAQVQARLAALFCNEEGLLEKFNSDDKFDIHADVARAIMQLSYTPSKDSPERKDIGKTFGFSALFGAYPKRIRRWMRDKTDNRVKWDLKQATEARENFFISYPGFERGRAEYRAKAEVLAIAANHSIYPFRWDSLTNKTIPFHIARSMGKTFIRPRQFAIKKTWNRIPPYKMNKFYKMDDDERVTYKIPFGNYYLKAIEAAAGEGFNHAIQGAEANLMKVAALNIHYAFIEAGFDDSEGIVIFNHDELVADVFEDHAQLAKEIMEREMVKASSIIGVDGVKILAEAKIGDNWYECK